MTPPRQAFGGQAEQRAKPTPGPWEWTVQDHSMAILHGPDMLIDHVLAVGPCPACEKRVKDGKWKWGRCMTPKEVDAKLLAMMRMVVMAQSSIQPVQRPRPRAAPATAPG